MWIFTNRGYVSIVEYRPPDARPHETSDCLLVRARVEGDLEALFPGCSVEVTEDADYRFRAVMPRQTVASLIAHEVMNIDYANFKDSVPRQRGPYLHALHQIWGIMMDLQHALSRKSQGSHRPSPGLTAKAGHFRRFQAALKRSAKIRRIDHLKAEKPPWALFWQTRQISCEGE